ncbi:riboflavin biosynthesis protein RibD, partial [Candidatus Pelagibacter sp.]|nr:riboflavin biosynthesis protein RibD [Candidatus Pelagibacter sp.]
YLVKKRLFNKFYLFKSKKILSKMVEHKEFTALKNLKQNYKKRLNLKSDFGKDLITLYKN